QRPQLLHVISRSLRRTGSPAFAEDDSGIGRDSVPKNRRPASPPAYVSIRLYSISVRGFQFRFLPRDGALDRGLHLLKGADLDLPDALAGDAEFGGEVFQRHRLFGEAPRLEDAAFARIEHVDRSAQGPAAMIEFLA